MPKKAAPKNSPAHDATLAEIEAGEAAGEDVFGDDEEIVAEGADAEGGEDADAEAAADAAIEADAAKGKKGEKAEAAEVEEAAAETEEEAVEEVAAAAVEEEAEIDDAPQPYRGMSTADMEKERNEANALIAASMKKMIGGEVEPEEHAKLQVEQQKRLDKVVREEARYEASQDAILNYENTVYRNVAATARKAGLVYEPNSIQARQFDAAMSMLRASRQPGDTLKSMAREANEMVLAKHGKEVAKAVVIAKAKVAAPAAPVVVAVKRVPPKTPLTLRNVPAASTPNSGATLVEALRPLKGQAFQKRWGNLSADQRKSLLDD